MLLKQISIFALAVLLASSLLAQEVPTVTSSLSTDSMRTLVHLKKINRVGLYIQPEFQYGQSNGPFTPFAGNSLMLIFNKRFALGGAGYVSTDRTYTPGGVAPLALRSGFGGLKMEYTINPDAPLHVTIPLIIGAGAAQADSVGTDGFGHGNHTGFEDGHDFRGLRNGEYFMVQPGLLFEANVIRYAKLFVGAQYRFATPFGNENTLPRDVVSGFGISAGVKLGVFDAKLRKINLRNKWRKSK